MKIEYVNITVQCPGTPFPKPEKIQLKVGYTAAGEPVPVCNGCDSMNDTMPCDICCAALVRAFRQQPWPDITKRLNPLLL